jgi:hypothetical protein
MSSSDGKVSDEPKEDSNLLADKTGESSAKAEAYSDQQKVHIPEDGPAHFVRCCEVSCMRLRLDRD